MIALRSLLVVVLVVAPWAVPAAKAQAACTGSGCDQGQAYAAALSWASTRGPAICTLVGTPSSVVTGTRARHDEPNRTYYGEVTCSGVSGWVNTGSTYYSHGMTCSARPPMTGGYSIVGSAGTSCTDGCVYGIGGSGVAVTVGGKTYASTDGATPTGATCGSSTAGQAVVQDDCQQIGNLTQCVTPQGKHCVQASNGQRFCWNPSEAGVKRDGNQAATKAPEGASINAPSTAPPNGGEWSQNGSGSVSTQKGSTTNNYIISTWISTYGGEGDGTPDGNGGEGDENNGGPSASGGATCDSQPSCSDMSSVECNQLIQTWYLRCKGVDLSGGDTCDSPPTCSGDAGSCYIGATLWRMRCDGTGGQGDSDTIGKGLEEIVSGEGDGTDEPEISGVSEGDFPEVKDLWVEKDGNALMDQLDASGFLSDRSCPTLPAVSVAGTSVHFDLKPMCSLATSAGALVLALSYWIGFRIIAKAHT